MCQNHSSATIPFSTSRQHVLSSVLQNPVGPSQLQLVQRLAVISHTPLDSLLSHAPFGELGREELEVTLPEVSDDFTAREAPDGDDLEYERCCG